MSAPRVLVVEDDALIGMAVAQSAEHCGCTVVGPVMRLSAGIQAAETAELDGAILDIDLGSEQVWPVAEILQRRGTPFVLLSGYSSAEVPEGFWKVPLVAKPSTDAALHRALVEAGIVESRARTKYV